MTDPDAYTGFYEASSAEEFYELFKPTKKALPNERQPVQQGMWVAASPRESSCTNTTDFREGQNYGKTIQGGTPATQD